ncbi:hypothetical protein, partial [uncultured Fibrobacter sp.]|uniref:hypothetical protein n=1 Tax=uncultured Fibrobacter sp. TaxID=261512 RepID=UPI0025F69499
ILAGAYSFMVSNLAKIFLKKTNDHHRKVIKMVYTAIQSEKKATHNITKKLFDRTAFHLKRF